MSTKQKIILAKTNGEQSLSAYEYVNNKSTQGYTTEPCDLERLLTEGWEIQSVTALGPTNELVETTMGPAPMPANPGSYFVLMILRMEI